MHIASARFRFTPFRWCRNPPRGLPLWKSRLRNLAFVLWRDRDLLPTVPAALQRGETMELLQLEPPDYGVRASGIYIINDDGISVLAGPFESETVAISWIDQRQEILIRTRPAHASAAA
jgi:hypothetical protein